MKQFCKLVCLVAFMTIIIPANSQEILKTAKHERIALAGGGYSDTYTFSDNTRIIISVQPCLHCNETGICQVCQGNRVIYSSFGGYGQMLPCYTCRQTGQCQMCGGTGQFVNIFGLDGKSMRYVFKNSAGAEGFGTAVVHDYSPYRSSNKDRTYVEKIEYAPDYTGQNVRVYCDKCGCYAYPHTHIKQPVR